MADRVSDHWRANRSTDADRAWRLTVVFAMGYVRGFDAQIVAALEDADAEIRYEAVGAAGNWGVAAAWPYVANLLTSAAADKPLLLAAIEAAAARLRAAGRCLTH